MKDNSTLVWKNMFKPRVVGFILVSFHRTKFETNKTSMKEIVILPYDLIDCFNISLLKLFSFNGL